MVFAVTSGKGGTGKSCVAAYTGAAFAKQGKKVLVVEMGANTRSIDLILDAQEDVKMHFVDIMAGNCSIEKAIVQSNYHPDLYLLPGPPLPGFYTAEISWYHQLLKDLTKLFDIILLDGVDFHAFPPELADTIILVVTPDSLAIRGTAMHARGLFEIGLENMRLIINRVSPTLIPMNGARDFDDVIDAIGAQLLGVIPESPILQYSSNNGEEVDSGSLTIEVFDNIAKRLSGEHPLLLVK